MREHRELRAAAEGRCTTMSDMMPDQFEVPDKEPGYVYRWCNSDERAMLTRKAQGYEVVMDDKPEIDPRVQNPDAPASSTGGVTRRRGSDLVLCRIKKEVFDEKIDSRRRALREQHRGSIDDTIVQTNRETESALRRAGQGHTRGLVFRTTPEADFSKG